MAEYKDISVVVTKQTAGITLPTEGLTLILSTETTKPYKVYSDLPQIGVDFGVNSDAYGMAGAFFAQSPKPDKVAVVGIEYTTDFSEVINALNLIVAANGEFAYLVSNELDILNVETIAAWATNNRRYYVFVAGEGAIDIIPDFASDYVIVMVHDGKDVAANKQYADAALLGSCSTFLPGSATWAFKTLNGITPQEYVDQSTVIEELNAKHFMTYVTKMGNNETTGGFATSGEYIDILLGIDALTIDLQVQNKSVLINNKKVPYDNKGISKFVAATDGVLKTYSDDDHMLIRQLGDGSGEYSIQVPDITEIPKNDIANREFKALTFEAALAGAIQYVGIRGTVFY